MEGKMDRSSGVWKFFSQDSREIEFSFLLKNKALENIKIVSRVGDNLNIPRLAFGESKGSIPFKLLHFKYKKPLIPEIKTSPAASYDFLFPEPIIISNHTINDSVRKLLFMKYMGESNLSLATPLAITNFINQLALQYQEENRDIYDPSDPSMILNHEFNIKPLIICNSKFLLSIAVQKYVYTGSAHGLEATQFINVNLKNGKDYSLSELLQINNSWIVGSLLQLIKQKIKEKYGLSAEQPLTNAGFFTDEIGLPVEFYLTPSGIGFFYNVYEIAPYAMGPIHVFLQWNELKMLMGENLWVLPNEFYENSFGN
ncbi:MAG: DUF3298 domain-containing protein [Bacteroidales bacterium]|nr:DUF3298 and DUF4163 domain-containing protein [Bacteroidales bacterium]NPV36533.1 DUF3298 domain-containing protein [Bacteroidales bacterium]